MFEHAHELSPAILPTVALLLAGGSTTVLAGDPDDSLMRHPACPWHISAPLSCDLTFTSEIMGS